MAMRLRRAEGHSDHSIANGSATSAANCARSGSAPPSPPTNAIRMKKAPPSGSVECWSDATTLAPRSNRKPATAATIPGRSGHAMSRRLSSSPAIALRSGRGAAPGAAPRSPRRGRGPGERLERDQDEARLDDERHDAEPLPLGLLEGGQARGAAQDEADEGAAGHDDAEDPRPAGRSKG